MLNSLRRLISYPNPDRSDVPDIPLFIKNVVDKVDLDIEYAYGLAGSRPAAGFGGGTGGKVYKSTDTGALDFDTGSTWVSMLGGSLAGVYASRPTPSASNAGLFYYATDKDALYRSTGLAWNRIGNRAGDLLWTMDNAAPAGTVALLGQTVSRTGLFDELFTRYGTRWNTGSEAGDVFRLPDAQGRAPVVLGAHSSVNGVNKNEGAALANRAGVLHRHMFSAGTSQGVGALSLTPSSNELGPTYVGSVNTPLDGGAFVVVNAFFKL